MKKVADYRQHAEECRVMARRSGSAEQRQMLFVMAGTWDSLAEQRLNANARQERMAKLEAK
jgi:hypothetical protein